MSLKAQRRRSPNHFFSLVMWSDGMEKAENGCLVEKIASDLRETCCYIGVISHFPLNFPQDMKFFCLLHVL